MFTSSSSSSSPSKSPSKSQSKDNESLLSHLKQTFKKLSAIDAGDKAYTLQQLITKTLGDDSPVDDRKVPFEKLMGVLATLPKDISDSVTQRLIADFWKDLEHPTRYWPAIPFRSADGSNNSHIYPHMGASNTSYARSVTGKYQQIRSELPDPRELFRDLMQRPASKPFEPHPNGINALLFSLAGVITHDLFRSSPIDPAVNLTTHYADLSPLYGSNQKEQDRVRTFKNGLLHPDTFADPRLQFQLPGIVAMLIIFSRNHNYIATQLLSDAVNVAEDYRFTHVDGKDSPQLSPERTDELVFQTARLINGGCYANIILHEYLRTILGIPIDSEFTLNPLATPPATDPKSGNVVSIEFGYIYRWHSAISDVDAQWLEKFPIAKKYMELKRQLQSSDEKNGDHGKILAEILKELNYTQEELTLGPVCIGLHRDPTTRAFNSADFIKVLQTSIESVSSRMGARKVPAVLEEIEVQGIRAARKTGLCTLNELRRFFHLKEYKSYEDMLSGHGVVPDPEVIRALEKHYGPKGIDRVELYPGVVIEASKVDGISLPYTSSRAILSDAVNLLRNDRFYTDGLNPHDLTVWGFNYINAPGDTSLSDGSVFKKILLNAFPEWAQVIGDPNKADLLLKSPFRIPTTTPPPPHDSKL
ncbi:hypothetical protein BGZ76_010129 [Entomortierella beljakovae]|nr:hypothetical protein BGZ76_010129 [Entomortierella beljakovae]